MFSYQTINHIIITEKKSQVIRATKDYKYYFLHRETRPEASHAHIRQGTVPVIKPGSTLAEPGILKIIQ